MRYRAFRIEPLLIASVLSLASGCATKQTELVPLLPPVADLKVEAKPQLRPEDLQSEEALTAHDIALEAWGERGWAAVGRICRWAQANGLGDAQCPAATQDVTQ